jgi:hypothetical protein
VNDSAYYDADDARGMSLRIKDVVSAKGQNTMVHLLVMCRVVSSALWLTDACPKVSSMTT